MSFFGLSKLINDAGQTAGTDATPLTVKLQALLASVHSISIGPNATNGASKLFLRNLSNTPTPVKASAGVVYGLTIGNKSGADAWIQMFDTSATPTLGSSMNPEIYVPSATSLQLTFGLYGLQYTNGIYIAATNAEGGTLAVANGLLVTVAYT